MLNQFQSRPFAFAVLFAGHFAFGQAAFAQSNDPDPGHGAPAPTSGLGLSHPDAVDLAANIHWQVYKFERDGIRYYQINDANHQVRAAVGTIGGTFWTLPLGVDADRVVLPGDPAPTGTPTTLYLSNGIEIALYQTDNGEYWVIRDPNSQM